MWYSMITGTVPEFFSYRSEKGQNSFSEGQSQNLLLPISEKYLFKNCQNILVTWEVREFAVFLKWSNVLINFRDWNTAKIPKVLNS